MSVVVRMEMPDKCGKCPLAWYDGAGRCFCMVSLERNDAVDDGMMWKEADPNKKPSWCPIICSFTGEEESPSPKPTDPVPIRDVYYVMTECDVKTGTVTYELRERSET